MQHTVANSISAKRFTMTLLAVFAALALLLASIGIYGVLSYLVGQRTQEIGVRMALGAQRLHVLRMVLKDGIRMTLIGIGIGLVAALCLARFMSSMLFGVKPTDPLTFGVVAVLLCAIAMLACYVPARRAQSGSDHCVAAPIAEIAVQKHFPLSMLVCTARQAARHSVDRAALACCSALQMRTGVCLFCAQGDCRINPCRTPRRDQACRR